VLAAGRHVTDAILRPAVARLGETDHPFAERCAARNADLSLVASAIAEMTVDEYRGRSTRRRLEGRNGIEARGVV
jgi:hypothetical protein